MARITGYGYGYGDGYGSGYGDGYGDGSGYGYGLQSDVQTDVGFDASAYPGLGVLRIGCQVHHISHWREHWREIAAEHGVQVTEAEVEAVLAQVA